MHYIFLILAALLRVIPHPYNITPMASIGLFAGTWCDRRIAWLIPLIPLFISDMIIGPYNYLIMIFVYAGIALSAVIGRLFLARKRSLGRFAGAISVNALMFYLVSNFPVWWIYYPRSLAGLVECYVMGIPFLGYSLIGDTLFVTLLFGTYYLAQKTRGVAHAGQTT